MINTVEIDHNFSRAHRIVTTSILPVVEQYAGHSKNVWESSKFWKQFFEASANVSLSGYEEPPEQEETVTEDATVTTPSTPAFDDDQTATPQPNARQPFQPTADDSSLSTTPPEQSTPRPGPKQHPHQEPSMALYSSPYEALKREIKGDSQQTPSQYTDNSTLPSTPRNPFQQSDPDGSSPLNPPSTSRRPTRTPKDDPLLHRILDKNWRLQATPHTTTRALKPGTSTLPYRTGRTPARKGDIDNGTATPAEGKGKGKGKGKPQIGTMDDNDDDLDSSPAVPAPQLHSEIFGTPAQRTKVPGVSVLTPARGGLKRTSSQRREGKTLAAGEGDGKRRDRIWDSDSEDDDYEGGGAGGFGMSPPKTIQFHVPQSRLLRTPGEYFELYSPSYWCVLREGDMGIAVGLTER